MASLLNSVNIGKSPNVTNNCTLTQGLALSQMAPMPIIDLIFILQTKKRKLQSLYQENIKGNPSRLINVTTLIKTIINLLMTSLRERISILQMNE